ncbi:hypothetical protein BDQ17DRAFT_1433353 [Cyathus striatus]|nr:hypothetical protein BDQ17DRAFT_1433353 [Cyathus striatus]
MNLFLLFMIAFSAVTFGTPVDVVHHTVEMRQLSPSELKNAMYRRRFRMPTMGGRGGGLAGVADGIFNIIGGFKDSDNKRREKFVHDALDKYGRLHPGCNIIVVHTDLGYDKNFQGQEGKDWGKAHEEVWIKIGGGSKGYDIFWFKKGTFVRHGDGGWLNWGYTGSPKREDNKLTYTR